MIDGVGKFCANCRYFKPDSDTEGYGICELDREFGEKTDLCEFYKEKEDENA